MEIKKSELKLSGRDAEKIYRNPTEATDEQLAAASIKFDRLSKEATVRRDTCSSALEERVSTATQLTLFEVDGNKALYADDEGNVVAVDESHFDANYKALIRYGRGCMTVTWDDPQIGSYFTVSISVNKDNLVRDLMAGKVPAGLASIIKTSVQPKLFITKSASVKNSSKEE